MNLFTIRITSQFFDRPAVIKAVDRAKKRELSRAGAYVRSTARRSIKPARRKPKARPKRRRRKPAVVRTSQPGQPPKMHTRTGRNLRLILFAWEPTRQSVVIGPVLFKSRDGVRIPEVLEKGGRSYAVKRGKKYRTRVAARPYMSPALAANAPKFPDLFRNSVRP